MNRIANSIKNRLSLRQPQAVSLDILAELTDKLMLKKIPTTPNPSLTKAGSSGSSSPPILGGAGVVIDEGIKEWLTAELEKVRPAYPTCTDFERNFPSICFALATGVGKTRLMGAFIAYLYLTKGIKNFFVLAPNLTIYDKLINDFSISTHPKYVFKGIGEFVHNQPVIITGGNYNNEKVFGSDVRINIFNVSKFNSDNRVTRSGGKSLPPRMKRLSEFMGESYWNYLSNLPDLVILMDEAHRYHADASRNAINELNPVLGIELTATPIDEKGNPFKNVVYEYSLAQALTDGKFVKNPAIATRKNFTAQGLTDKEIEIIKLEDAVSIHEDTKNELELFARTNKVHKVNPFILIVCRDIAHAKEIFAYVTSEQFFKGAYKSKVLQIDSSTRSEEAIEKQFLTLEHDDNQIEIVIHVNMLKEGWDVTNLYTIVPLRAANASILIEQTIGRGLRLPYDGKRTGVDKVDKLTVVAHDNFEKVIAEAQNPQSVLNKFSYIEIPEDDLKTQTTVVSSVSKISAALQEEEKRIAAFTDTVRRQKAQNSYDAKKLILETINDPEIVMLTKGLSDYEKPEIQQKVIEKATKTLDFGQQMIFREAIISEMPVVYQNTLVEFRKNIIEIPRMDLVQEDVKAWFEHFDLDTSAGFDFKVLQEEIIRRGLKDNVVDTIGVMQGAFVKDTPAKQIVGELISYSYPEIAYDDNADLLHHLADQAVAALETKLDDKAQLPLLIRQYRHVLADRIYEQMKRYFRISERQYRKPRVFPFVKIEDWNFSALKNDGYRDYRDVVNPTVSIPKYVYRGFEKACHFEYKFDSKTEKDFVFILEHDKEVLKWLRPAPNQFRIYWANNDRRYNPDFIAEAPTTIYMIETKKKDDIESPDTQGKAKAALEYCKHATEFTTQNSGKQWKYVLIPHNAVQANMGFDTLMRKHER